MNSTLATTDRPRVGLITNPHSRRNRTALAALEARVSRCDGIEHRVTRDASEIPQALREFAARDVGVVAINGGDGTTAQVFAALFENTPFEKPPTVVLLPGGTTNMNAADAGMRGRLGRAVNELCRWADGETTGERRLRRSVLRVEGALGQPALYGMFLGAGTIVRGIEYCHRHVHRVGLVDEIGPGVALLRAVWGVLRGDDAFAAPIDASIRLHGERDTRDIRLVILLATSLERLFLGMRPWWGNERGPLHCTWLQQPVKRLFRHIPGVLRGRPAASASPRNGYFSHDTASIELHMDATFTIDGELYRASRAHGPLRIGQAGELEFLKVGS